MRTIVADQTVFYLFFVDGKNGVGFLFLSIDLWSAFRLVLLVIEVLVMFLEILKD